MKQVKVLRVFSSKGNKVRVAVPATVAPKSMVGAFKCCCSNDSQ